MAPNLMKPSLSFLSLSLFLTTACNARIEALSSPPAGSTGNEADASATAARLDERGPDGQRARRALTPPTSHGTRLRLARSPQAAKEGLRGARSFAGLGVASLIAGVRAPNCWADDALWAGIVQFELKELLTKKPHSKKPETKSPIDNDQEPESAKPASE